MILILFDLVHLIHLVVTSLSRQNADDQSPAGSGWKAATMLATMRIPTDNQRPARTPFGPSDKAPLRSGPTHCPIPNAIVSAAIAAVQACGLAALRANEVTAAMTASTDPPKRMDER